MKSIVKILTLIACGISFNAYSQGVTVCSPIVPPLATVANSVIENGEYVHSMTRDRDGFTYVTGWYAHGNSDDNIFVAKMDGNCNVIWINQWANGYHRELPSDITVNTVGDIFVTGIINYDYPPYDNDFLTVRFDPSGNYVSHRIIAGTANDNDAGISITTNKMYADLVFVTGYTVESGGLIYGVTMAYDRFLVDFWTQPEYYLYNSSRNSKNYSICDGADGNVYVTGESEDIPGVTIIHTLRYDATVPLLNFWDKYYWYNRAGGDPPIAANYPNRIVAHNDGVIVGGTVTGKSEDFIILRYDLNGGLNWEIQYGDVNDDEILHDVYYDKISTQVYATGETNRGHDKLVTTLALNSSGVLNWDNLYNDSHREFDAGIEIDVDCNGHPYVGTQSQLVGNTDHDYLVLGYGPSNGIINYNAKFSLSGRDAVLNDIVVSHMDNKILTSGTVSVLGAPSLVYVPSFDNNVECKEARYASDNKVDVLTSTSVYPNPSSGKFKLKSEFEGVVQIQDIQNRIVGDYSVKEGENEFDLSKFEDGVYYLIYLDNSGTNRIAEKIIINK